MDGLDKRDFQMRGIPGCRPRIKYGVTFFRRNDGKLKPPKLERSRQPHPALHSQNHRNIIVGKITNFAMPTAAMSA